MGTSTQVASPDRLLDWGTTYCSAALACCLRVGIAASFGRESSRALLWQRVAVTSSGTLHHWLIPPSPKAFQCIITTRWTFASTRRLLAGRRLSIRPSSCLGTAVGCIRKAKNPTVPSFSASDSTIYPVSGLTTAHYASCKRTETRARVGHLQSMDTASQGAFQHDRPRLHQS